MLAECERGEDSAKAAYEAALQKSLPADATLRLDNWAGPGLDRGLLPVPSATRREPGILAKKKFGRVRSSRVESVGRADHPQKTSSREEPRFTAGV